MRDNLDGYRVEVTFSNGQSGVADLAESLIGPVFERLKDSAEFSRFRLDEELDTLVWENGADLAPEYLFFQAFKDDQSLREQFVNWGYLPA